jgi:predicted metalloprotease with PDZ domain
MNLFRRRVSVALVWLSIAYGSANAQTLDPIRYTLSFPAPHTHYVDVEATVPTARKPEVDLMMAVWTPGSYLVREFSRQVEGLAARGGGTPLRVTKTEKNHWRIETAGAPTITVAYRVYGREMTVRTNYVERQFALLNGAATYLTLTEPRAKRPHEVRLTLPAAWKITMTALPAVPGGAAHHYRAEDFDTLVDSPILAGNPAVYERDVEKIVREAVRMWGSAPYEKYVFLNLITEGSGGLEHKNSTVLMTSRWATSTRERYRSWLKLVSHEFFHAWNVKRLRPIELGPFDYDQEVYTTGLWVAEGVTDYYGDLIVRRAGLSDDAEYLQDLSQLVRSLQTTPGRLVQPIETASFDAWIRHYRPDENSPNVAISYYTKGAVLGFLLDAKIRKATNDAKSLDDAMRLAYQRFSGPKGYTAQEFRKTVHDVAGMDFGSWWHTVLETTTELDYTEALDWFGLRFKAPDTRAERATLGLVTRVDNGRLLVSQVHRGTPGYDAGFNVDDEILAIGEFRVRPEAWATSMERYKPGQTASVLVARRDRLERLDVTFGREPADTWRLEASPDAPADRQQHFKALVDSGPLPSAP